jgi:uncharacterized protein YbgA (DUF1722 family)
VHPCYRIRKIVAHFFQPDNNQIAAAHQLVKTVHPADQKRRIGPASLLSEPLTLLKHHLNRYPAPEWVHQQVYLHPYPKELMLRNHV